MPRVLPVLLVGLFAAVAPAQAARAVPLPRPKPLELQTIQAAIPVPLPRPAWPEDPAPAIPTTAPAATPDAVPPAEPPPPPVISACRLKLAEVAAVAPLPPLTGPGECGAVDVVRLEGLVLRDWSRVTMNPPAVLRCDMAQAVVDWIRDDVATVAMSIGSPLVGIENYDSYDCRGRNRVVGAKTSEHGKGNAIDIRAFRLADGRRIEWTDLAVAKPPREALKASACARFMTVLGPGSDGYHESHIHVDLAERRGNYRMCQWDVRDLTDLIPLPRPRPAEAPARAAKAGEGGEEAEPEGPAE